MRNMKRPTNRFEVRPTPAEIKEVAKYHEAFQEDYCKAWLADGSKRLFKNDMPIVSYYSGGQGSYYFIEFVNKHLYKEGSFGRLGIIRSKRIIKGVPAPREYEEDTEDDPSCSTCYNADQDTPDKVACCNCCEDYCFYTRA